MHFVPAIKGTLQAAREKVTDLRARKDRLVTRLRAVQDMLEVDQGLFIDS